jgi:hypothetical protein
LGIGHWELKNNYSNKSMVRYGNINIIQIIKIFHAVTHPTNCNGDWELGIGHWALGIGD